jgi:hypothetical protein
MLVVVVLVVVGLGDLLRRLALRSQLYECVLFVMKQPHESLLALLVFLILYCFVFKPK